MTSPTTRRRRPARVELVVLLTLSLALAGLNAVRHTDFAAADSASLSFAPTDDTSASIANRTTNYGASPTLVINASGTAGSKTYLKFDISGLPAGAVVAQATLFLTATNSSLRYARLKPVSLSTNWTETTLVWSNRPAYTSTTAIVSSPAKVTAGQLSFNVTTLVASNGTVGFGIYQSASTYVDQIFSSKEGTATPRLQIDYSFTPPTPTGSSLPPSSSSSTSSSSTSSSSTSSSSTSTSPSSTSSSSTSTSPSSTFNPGPNPCGLTQSPPATYSHVIWIFEENKTYSQVIGDTADAPYINTLASQCATATNYADAGHFPSLPNYLAATSGSNQGITTDGLPSTFPPVTADNIFRQVRAAGQTEKSYEEDMPSNCYQANSGRYAVRHNPDAYFVGADDQADCQQNDVPLGTTASGNLLNDITNNTLPNFALVTPNTADDGHSAIDLATQVRNTDAWLQSWLPTILSSQAYQAGSTAVLIMWDEDTPTPNLWIAPSVVPGTTVGASSHYSLLRTTEELLGIGNYLLNAATAPSMRSSLSL